MVYFCFWSSLEIQTIMCFSQCSTDVSFKVWIPFISHKFEHLSTCWPKPSCWNWKQEISCVHHIYPLTHFEHLEHCFCPFCVSLSAVEQERDLLQPRPYWKEFRFDLTPLPQGETVTAAEFRIYKTLTIGQRANRTLHISVYEIKRENRHRYRSPPHILLIPRSSSLSILFSASHCKLLQSEHLPVITQRKNYVFRH